MNSRQAKAGKSYTILLRHARVDPEHHDQPTPEGLETVAKFVSEIRFDSLPRAKFYSTDIGRCNQTLEVILKSLKETYPDTFSSTPISKHLEQEWMDSTLRRSLQEPTPGRCKLFVLRGGFMALRDGQRDRASLEFACRELLLDREGLPQGEDFDSAYAYSHAFIQTWDPATGRAQTRIEKTNPA